MSRSKIFSKSGVAVIALVSGLCFSVTQAEAQSCDPPGAAATAASGTIVPSIITQATNVISGITSSFTQFIGPVTGALGSIGSVTGGCIDMVSCMQMYFSQLGSTNTNNQMMNSSLMAKGHDYAATNAYALQLQTEQSRQAIKNGQGTSAGSNSLSYMNNSLCVPATLSTGAAQATAGTNVAVLNEMKANTSAPASGGGSYPTGPATIPAPATTAPSATEARQPFISTVTSISNLFTAGNAYAMPTGGSATSSEDPNATFALDTSASRLLAVLSYTPTQIAAANLYQRYIAGVPPEVPPYSTSSSAATQQATLAEREKIAFLTTATLGPRDEQALRMPFNNTATSAVTAIYNAVGQSKGAPSGTTSKALLMDSLFRMPVEDPNKFVNIASLGEEPKILQFIAGELLLANYMSYERYMIERKMLDVQGAQLAIAYRGFNFQGQP